jgi:hypothetical protein
VVVDVVTELVAGLVAGALAVPLGAVQALAEEAQEALKHCPAVRGAAVAKHRSVTYCEMGNDVRATRWPNEEVI